MKSVLSLRINGQLVERAVSPNITLLEFLRYEAGLTGTKQGCDMGDCGACTVLVDGKPTLSCLTLAFQAVGKEIRSIEGLSKGPELHPIQEAFDRAGALQCGFCQPGMMMSAAALLERNEKADPQAIREALSGNLCRCTGYTKIFDAVCDAVARIAESKSGTPPGQVALDGMARQDNVGAQPYVPPGSAPPPEIANGTSINNAAEDSSALVNPDPRSEQSASSPLPPSLIGSRQRKVEGRAKAAGITQYTDDLALPRMLHCKILRSSQAHARIVSIDTARAEALPGVYAVLLGHELPQPYGIIPWTRDEQVLCTDRARYIGDAIAAVAAETEAIAEEALSHIKVEFEPLPAIMTLEEALAPNAPKIHEGNKKGNISKHVRLEFGEVDEALDAADVVEEGVYYFEGSTHAAIEPHCALARFDPDGQLSLWSSTQVPHYLHRELARVLAMDEKKIRVIQPALGGAFGGKSEPFDLEFVAAALSRKTGRPVKILYTREEVFYSHRGRHPMKMHLRLGATRDGKLSGLDSTIKLDGGAYSSFGLVTAYYAGQLLTGPTHFPTYRFDATRVFTNKPACGPKRGHGSVQPRFAFEVALDKLAHRLGIDPIELRRLNDLGSSRQTVNGQLITSNGFLECLNQVEAASGWKQRYGKLPYGRGLGVAGSMYISGTNYPIYPNSMPQSGVSIKVDRSGKVAVFSGASDIGQGSDSMLALITAQELGCLPEDIRVVSADTDLTPVDLGAYSSRGTMMVGNATRDAAAKLARQLKQAVGAAWNVPPERIELREGWARLPGEALVSEEKAMPIREAFQRAEILFGTLGATGSYNTPLRGGAYRGGTIGASPAYSFTAHVVDLSVDPESGEIEIHKVWAAHDCGRALNPTLVEGQIEGSVYMGIGEALTEAYRFHEEPGPAQGLHRGPSLLDYRIPTSEDTPPIETFIVESIDPEGPYGAKEAGEGPLHPVIPAISNAIFDAVGVRMNSLPFSPAHICQAIRVTGLPAARDASAAEESC